MIYYASVFKIVWIGEEKDDIIFLDFSDLIFISITTVMGFRYY